MKKIKWIPSGSKNYARVEIGCISIYIKVHYATKRWYANVSIAEQVGTFRDGPLRKSMVKAKEDAVRIARELLFDYRVCIDAELKNWE